jgi:hypothetical protein
MMSFSITAQGLTAAGSASSRRPAALALPMPGSVPLCRGVQGIGRKVGYSGVSVGRDDLGEDPVGAGLDDEVGRDHGSRR